MLYKYYTPDHIAKQCIGIVNKLDLRVSEFIEPSAGSGGFSSLIEGCIAYDIAPEGVGIIKQDFLKLDLPYKQGRMVIGNPPFGERNVLSVKFFKHACKMSDYVAFILPVSQYKNNQQMYDFDLIYSELLPQADYSGTTMECCFNVYKRPDSGKLNSRKPDYKLKDVFVGEYRRGGNYKMPESFDFAMCSYGYSLGKEVHSIGRFCQEIYLVVKKETYRDQVIRLMRETDWKHLYPYTTKPKIQVWKVYKYIKEQILDIE